MSESSPASRVTIDGKSFRLGARKFHPRGVVYGPFAETPQTGTFPSRAQVLMDFDLIQQLGANLLRVYDVPPPWFLDLALAHDLRLLIDIPWSKHLCFLDRPDQNQAAQEAVRQATRACAGHPAVFAYSVANEIPTGIVRWHGSRRVARFLDRLIDIARENDPGCLCTFASFPPTEFLAPKAIDFVCFNVFLHDRRAFADYLARLQILAGARPLVLSECGMDSLREGEVGQAHLLSWQIESAFRAGAAGFITFSFTDDWVQGGRPIEDWAFGLTTKDRGLKEAFRAVQRQYRAAPYFRLSRLPRISVVVACRDGERTLRVCLDALCTLGYPDYEVLLVDDGSTDGTAQITQGYPGVRYLRQSPQGLSAARNAGITAAVGEIIAFTDADCRPDEDWLYSLVQELLSEGVAGVGGPNVPPPDDSRVAAAVAASPGRPNHVMLTDRDAEHVPGCNMAFWRWALQAIGGFDPIFHRAGDDVDVCWRLLERGWKIRFSATALVWHYHRPTVRAYLTQQFGYGEAEALLAGKHPEYFNALGRSQWRGCLYGPTTSGMLFSSPVIYRGIFGTAAFQRIYQVGQDSVVAMTTSLEYHALVTGPLLVLGAAWPLLLPLGLASLALSCGTAAVMGAQAPIPPAQTAFWSRPLLGLLAFLQPLARGWARHRWKFTTRSVRPSTFRRSDLPRPPWLERPHRDLTFFSEEGVDRLAFLQDILDQFRVESWEIRVDRGWSGYDVEVFGRLWSRARVNTVAEELGEGRRVLRCRIRTGISLLGRWMLGTLCGAALVASMAWPNWQPWVFFAWAVVPIHLVLVAAERRLVLQLTVALVDTVAQRLKLNHLLPPSATATLPRRPLPTRSAGERDDLEELL